jgi:type II secretory ATPase GspE/PulE/Tfp pilus assembly ATPase PilB-like protein
MISPDPITMATVPGSRTVRDLAEVLLEHNFVDRDNLALAQEMSQLEGLPLTRILQNLDLIDEEKLAQATALQYDLAFVHLDLQLVSPELAKLIDSDEARREKIVPIARIGNTVTIAVSQPLPLQKLTELERKTGLMIIPVIALEREIDLFLDRFFEASDRATSAKALEGISDSILDILAEATGEPEVEEETRSVTEKDSFLVKLVNKIICDAYTTKASDIHIEPSPGKKDAIVRFRIDGCCEIYQRIPYKFKYAITSRIKIMANLDIAERRKPQDGKINFRQFGPLDLELRVATMPTVGGLEDVVIRLLNVGGVISFDRLGLTPRNYQEFEAAIRQPHGLFLVVGPTGSGKTTTLHSAVARINTPKVKIWTAEDPVEITQSGLRQVQVNSKIGFTFATALRSFLRLDPDIIMVGEMRDLETASIAIEASLTGHLVLSTLHTNSAPETVCRLLEMGLDPFSFSDSLIAVLAQRLVRRLCPSCKELYKPKEQELNEIISEFGSDAFEEHGISREEIMMARAVGCPECLTTGYKGRFGIHEFLTCTDPMKGLIKKKADSEQIFAQASADNMLTLRQDGILKVLQGITDIHEIRRICTK